MVGVPVWLGLTRGSAILAGHPAMLVAGIACGLLGFVAVAWSVATLAIGGRQDREGDAEHPARRTPQQLHRRAPARIILAIPTLLICALLVGALAYARPLPATPTATAALRSADGVQIAERLSWYELIPARQDKTGKVIKPTIGLIFVPGRQGRPAGLRGAAAAVGLGGLSGRRAQGTARILGPAARPRRDGDRAASRDRPVGRRRSFARRGHRGGLRRQPREHQGPGALGASYPASALVRTDLAVLSVSGSADGLTTPAEIDDIEGAAAGVDHLRGHRRRRARAPSATTATSPATVCRSATGWPSRPRSPRRPRTCWPRWPRRRRRRRRSSGLRPRVTRR